MTSNDSPISITTTAETQTTLDQIAKQLLENKWAACCQISGPITSLYRWKGKIESTEEYVCNIKTMSTLLETVTRCIQTSHPYDEPEIIVTPIVGGSDGYLKWLSENCDGSPSEK